MHDDRFFDATLELIERGQIVVALPMLAGKLYADRAEPDRWQATRDRFQAHPLRTELMRDPYTRRAVEKPRGYAGDAALIDIIYDRLADSGADHRGDRIFDVTINFPTCEAVRLRCRYAAALLADAARDRQKTCVLACGHLREADGLDAADLSWITAVDQDLASLAVLRKRHPSVVAIEANVFRFLRKAVANGEKFDLIYTLGLTDYLDSREMALLHRMMRDCLAPGGKIILANFVPEQMAVGWMEAVMEWQLIYRNETELAAFARAAGLHPRCWRDPTGMIAWCEMRDIG